MYPIFIIILALSDNPFDDFETKMGPGLWGHQRPLPPNFRSPPQDSQSSYPYAVNCSRHKSSSGAAQSYHHNNNQNQKKSSTLDGDKKRLFLDRMRTNPFHNTQGVSLHTASTLKSKQPDGPPPRGSSTGVEILTDDEIGLTCSNSTGPSAAFFDLSGVPIPSQTPAKPPLRPGRQQQQFVLRSLGGESRMRTTVRDPRPLFGGDEVEDSPLLVSSIDGVTTQAGVMRSGKEGII